MNNLRYWILISFLIHALIFSMFVLPSFLKPKNHKKVEKLVVEFDITIGKEQIEEKKLDEEQKAQEATQSQQKMEEQKAQEATQQTQQVQEIKSQEEIKHEEAIKQKVEQVKPKPKTLPKTQPKQQQKAQEEKKATLKREETIKFDEQTKKQTIEDKKKDINELKRYLSKLKKQIQRNIVYPKEAKELNYKGRPEVEFYINSDGTVDRSSIKIVKSSGYEILDSYAIESVLKSSPFEKIDDPLIISVEVAFEVK